MTSKAAMKRALGPDYVAPEPRQRKKMGRPSDYEPWMIQHAADMAHKGATVLEICGDLGIGEVTIYRWMDERPDFRKAIEDGRTAFDKRVELRLQHRVLGGERETRTYDGDGALVARKVEDVLPSDRAIEMWLFNRNPNRWRNRTETSIVVPVNDAPEIDPGQPDVRHLALATLALLREAPEAPMIEGSVVAPYDTQEEPDSYDPLEEDEAFDL